MEINDEAGIVFRHQSAVQKSPEGNTLRNANDRVAQTSRSRWVYELVPLGLWFTDQGEEHHIKWDQTRHTQDLYLGKGLADETLTVQRFESPIARVPGTGILPRHEPSKHEDSGDCHRWNCLLGYELPDKKLQKYLLELQEPNLHVRAELCPRQIDGLAPPEAKRKTPRTGHTPVDLYSEVVHHPL